SASRTGVTEVTAVSTYTKKSLVYRDRYGVAGTGWTLVPLRWNSNRRIHSRAASPACAGVNVQCCAACIASRAKYLLGPVESNSAAFTLPAGPTLTRPLTLTAPCMI